MIVLPVDRQPGANERPAIDGMPPDHPRPRASNEALRTIRLLGGGYARAETGGRFEVHLPSRGRYFVLVLSKHAGRSSDTVHNKTTLAQIGRYLLPVTELLGDRKYEWRELIMNDDRQLEIEF